MGFYCFPFFFFFLNLGLLGRVKTLEAAVHRSLPGNLV
ncbi:hypothetical protein SLEP1_g8472 [Rubroshorea leprosula]|uniref:Uncharacterized protein n=1 Tax=Rubroshorea leprosula TaxID=152421 RepID=A0AAV5I6B8_9ROSI|nr:hypothetical protein SLEP1_g8472 [Rubroshorea leprosula]